MPTDEREPLAVWDELFDVETLDVPVDEADLVNAVVPDVVLVGVADFDV